MKQATNWILVTIAFVLGLVLGMSHFSPPSEAPRMTKTDAVLVPLIEPCRENVERTLGNAVATNGVNVRIEQFNAAGPILELVPAFATVTSEKHNIFQLLSMVDDFVQPCYPNMIVESSFNEPIESSGSDASASYRILFQQSSYEKEYVRE